MQCGGVAWAIPESQAICQGSPPAQTTSSTFAPIDDDFFVTVKNLFFTRDCIVTFSAEGAAFLGDTIVISYSIDGEGCPTSSPPFPVISLQGDSQGSSTHTAIAIFELGPGVHTIQPCFRNWGVTLAVIGRRCLTIECGTR